MFFFLSKTLAYLVMPLTLICTCYIACLIVRNPRWKKRLFVLACTALFFFSNEFIANEVMMLWELPVKPIESLPSYKLGIVLTGVTVSREPNDRIYLTKGADRITHTVQLFKLGRIEKILISGGSGRIVTESEPEADKFRRAMLMMGVPDSAIIIENETRNTAESATQVKKMLENFRYSDRDCLLITSAFHMRRSLACYRKVGLDVDYFSTDFYTFQRGYTLDSFIIPKVEAIVTWNKLIREWIGFVAYKVAGYI